MKPEFEDLKSSQSNCIAKKWEKGILENSKDMTDNHRMKQNDAKLAHRSQRQDEKGEMKIGSRLLQGVLKEL